MALGSRVKQARETARLTQAQLAEMVGVSQSAIHSLESRDSQSSKFIVELSHALGVSAEWLKNGGELVVDSRRHHEADASNSPSEETHVTQVIDAENNLCFYSSIEHNNNGASPCPASTPSPTRPSTSSTTC